MKQITTPTMQLPLTVGRLHFVGIGGIGMSGIAEILFNLGYTISGSDTSENANVKRLKLLGIDIFSTQCAKNIDGASAVIISTAIKDTNDEYIEAQRHRIPIVHRSEMLAEIMRLRSSIAIAGTHGKTTSLVAHSLSKAKLKPTIINGGIINSLGSNALLGEGKWLVAEADESDGTFTKLPMTIAVVTNMDPEHLDHYGDYDTMKKAFHTFINNVPFYGCAILCTDHQEVQKMALQISNRKVVTYGLNPQADVRGDNIIVTSKGTTFDVILSNGEVINSVFTPLFGVHNIQNSLASIAVCLTLEIPADEVRELLSDFGGVKRRFTFMGTFKGAKVIDDYAHHPVEIKAVLQAAKSACSGRVFAVMQPHRYTRLESLFDDFSTCFNDAHQVYITPVYTAGEDAIKNINSKSLTKNIILAGHQHAEFSQNQEKLEKSLSSQINANDLIIFLGAGDITEWAGNLPDNKAGE